MRHRCAVICLMVVLATAVAANADAIDGLEVPLIGSPVEHGRGLITSFAGNEAVTQKSVDGDISDWTGEITRYAGTSIYSRGEYVYQDYLMDDWGADNGQDAQRTVATDIATSIQPHAYRIEAMAQMPGSQLGPSCSQTICAATHYGDVAEPAFRSEGDIEEVRVAADATTLYFLVRTSGMTEPSRTGVLVLLGGPISGHAVPGGITTTARYAFVAAGNHAVVLLDGTQALATGAVSVATDPTGYANAVEIGIPRALLPGLGSQVRVGVATSVTNDDGTDIAPLRPGSARSDLLNVAFRFDEPPRMWMEHDQALALHDGEVDRWLTRVDLAKLATGYSESFEPRSGYWERIYESTSPVATEAEIDGASQGRFQHYGLYLPPSFRGGERQTYPATWWLHPRGGTAHLAAAWLPGIIHQFGEQHDNIMIFPSARGASSWWVGRGLEDFLESWDDALRALPVDQSRVYLSGYGMGGFGAWLLATLMPDRFAAVAPQMPPPTQGVFLGAGPNEADPPASAAKDGGNPQAELTYVTLDNASNVPFATFAGTNDPDTPLAGIEAMHRKLDGLGNDHRLYRLAGNEGTAAALLDVWSEQAAYLNRFRRDPSPSHVRYRTWPALEHALSTISTLPGQGLRYRFDGAYWVSGVEARDAAMVGGAPDPLSYATVDVTTDGRGRAESLSVPEAGAGAQGAPFVMTGRRTLPTGFVTPSNWFSASLENAAQATLDAKGMGLSTSETIEGTLSTDGATTLRFTGAWGEAPTVHACLSQTVCPAPAHNGTYDGRTLEIRLPSAGAYWIAIEP